MPRIKLYDISSQDAALRKAILGSAGYFQIRPGELYVWIGLAKATWYRRLRSPGEFTLSELRRMVRQFKWDQKTVCSILGVKEESK